MTSDININNKEQGHQQQHPLPSQDIMASPSEGKHREKDHMMHTHTQRHRGERSTKQPPREGKNRKKKKIKGSCTATTHCGKRARMYTRLTCRCPSLSAIHRFLNKHERVFLRVSRSANTNTTTNPRLCLCLCGSLCAQEPTHPHHCIQSVHPPFLPGSFLVSPPS